jgi:hypothetical protein
MAVQNNNEDIILKMLMHTKEFFAQAILTYYSTLPVNGRAIRVIPISFLPTGGSSKGRLRLVPLQHL